MQSTRENIAVFIFTKCQLPFLYVYMFIVYLTFYAHADTGENCNVRINSSERTQNMNGNVGIICKQTIPFF